VLYGIVPLLIALLVLEIVAEWREAPWPAKAAAYAIMAAAMFLSASATGSVVLHAAPGHFSLLPGALLDAAELLAAFFIMNGPTAAQAVAKVAARERELLGQVAAGRSALERAEAEFRAGQDDLKARAGAEIGRLRAAAEADLSALRTALAGELEARDRKLSETADALAAARSDAEKSAARVAVLERKLGGPARRSGTAPARSGTAPGTGARTAPQDDLDLEARALKLLATNLDMSGAELAEKLGISAGYGRKLRRRLAGDRPAEDGPDRTEDRSGTASEDRA
jgi:DNA-binding CsgD family transcriptional regulator